jgi:hypothetical protein
MIVPPWPSLDRLKFCAEYWPSSVWLPACVPTSHSSARLSEESHAQREVARASATRSAIVPVNRACVVHPSLRLRYCCELPLISFEVARHLWRLTLGL